MLVAVLSGAVLIAQTVPGKGSDDAIACSPSAITAYDGDRVVIHVRAPDGAPLTLQGKPSAGRVVKQPSGALRWDFTDVDGGHHTLDVRSTDAAGRTGSCSVVVRVRLGTRGERLISGRTLLARAEREESGYGLYTYLLFGSQPNPAMRERFMAALDAYLKVIPDIEGFQQSLPIAQRNVTFFPVDQQLSTDLRSDPTVFKAWLLAHHDYARARQILQPVAAARRDGPFLLSCTAPRSAQPGTDGPCLFQDLATIPPRLVSLWTQEFINQAQMAQFSGSVLDPSFPVRVRTAIAMLADNIPAVRVDELMRWTKN